MSRWSRPAGSLSAVGLALALSGACGGSTEVSFAYPDAAASGDSGAGPGGRGGPGAGGKSGSSASSGSGGSSHLDGGAGNGGALGTGESSGTAAGGSAGATASAGSAGFAPDASRDGSADSAGASGDAGTGNSRDGGACLTLVNPICPAEVPDIWSACNPCYDAVGCRYDRCKEENRMYQVSCHAASKVWTGIGTTCLPPCGGPGVWCKPEEICVRSTGESGVTYACRENPCGSQPVTCECAAGLCGGQPYVCTSAKDREVSCDCPACA